MSHTVSKSREILVFIMVSIILICKIIYYLTSYGIVHLIH